MILDDEEVETEGLIREYQKNAKPIQSTIKLLEFFGGEDGRKNEGAEMKRCIQRLVEEELVKDYQRDAEPDEETRSKIKEKVGAKWREDQGVEGRSYILGIIKEEVRRNKRRRKSRK